MSAYYLIYDNQCELCRQSVRRVRQLDRLGVVELVPMSDAFGRESDLPFKLPSHLELHKEIHLYSSEGQLWKGADALAQLATLFPRSKWLGKMIMWPGIRQVARWVYGKIAENRHRLTGSRK